MLFLFVTFRKDFIFIGIAYDDDDDVLLLDVVDVVYYSLRVFLFVFFYASVC